MNRYIATTWVYGSSTTVYSGTQAIKVQEVVEPLFTTFGFAWTEDRILTFVGILGMFLGLGFQIYKHVSDNKKNALERELRLKKIVKKEES